MFDSVRPHRRPPSRLPRPWDSPGKNTGVGCHFLLQCIKLKSESGRLLATSWTAAYQAPLSMGFSRQEYWSGVPLHSLQHHFTTLQILLSSFIIYETGTRREFIMAEEAERHLSIFPFLFLLRFCFRLLYFNFPLFWKSYQMSTNDWINMLIYFPNIQ